jgi:Na+-translocating ferredoxin:NAD+ oxidoreductase RnfG subunit
MSTSGICSRLAVGFAALGLFGSAGELSAQVSLREALESAFPKPAAVERRTAFLSDADLAAAQAEAGADAPVSQRVVTYYLATQDGKPVGVAYFDSHRVRTLNEVVMIVVQPGDSGRDDLIGSIEVLRFAEPPEYHASQAWLGQFQGKTLSPDLSLKRAIANLSGATLTSNAVTRAARRVLAIHRRIQPFKPAGAAAP